LKAQYIVDKDLRGTILWDLTGDYVATKKANDIVISTPLIDTINHVFNVNKKVVFYTTPAEYVSPVNPDLMKVEEMNKPDVVQVVTAIPIDTSASPQTQTVDTVNNGVVLPRIIEPVPVGLPSADLMDFKINSDETTNVSITFDLKLKREAFVNIKSLDGQILRGQPCGILDVGNHTISLTEIFVGIPATEYWIELSLPAFDIVPEEKVMHKWVKRL
jgi:hypothetical protein